MDKKVLNRCLRILLAVILVVAFLASITGCSVIDPLGVGRDSEIVTGDAGKEDSGDFLSSDEVMAFFDNTPGEKINSMHSLLKAIINATYIDELEMSVTEEGYETMAWHIAYGVINEYAREDKGIDFKNKKDVFKIKEDLALEYIQSLFAGISSKKSAEIAELLNTYNTMVTYNSKNKEYTMVYTDSAEFNAELIDVKIPKRQIKLESSKVDGATLTYQLTDMSESKYNLGKVKITLVKNEQSKFGYSIAKSLYSKKGFGEPTVIEETPSPDATPKAGKKK